MNFGKKKAQENRYTPMSTFTTYKATLDEFIESTKGRSMFSQTDVQDMLLDLRNAVSADEAVAEAAVPELVPSP